MIDTSYMGKLFITGPDASRAARHIFSRDVTGGKKIRPCTYTLMLNDRGGIESDLVVAKVESKKGGELERYEQFNRPSFCCKDCFRFLQVGDMGKWKPTHEFVFVFL